MNSQGQLRRIASHRLLLPDKTLLRNPLVTLGGDGTILHIESCDDIDRQAGTEFYDGILVPGFINAHCHLELSHMRGLMPRRTGMAGFARAMSQLRNTAGDDARTAAAAAAAATMYSEGVQAVGDISNGQTSFAAKAQSPIRFANRAEIFGLGATAAAPSAALLAERYGAVRTPHSTYSVSDSAFVQICRQGREPLSIHFLESPEEKELYQSRGELARWYGERGWSCDFLHYGTPAQRIAASVPADRSVMLVHCCCVNQEDIDSIMSHFTAPVWWCLCPRSNDYITGLRPPVELLLRNGLNICIGTDSLASNDTLSMLAEIKALDGCMPLVEALHAATAAGAAALGFDDLGAVRIGARPGLAVISGVDFQKGRLRDDASARRVV